MERITKISFHTIRKAATTRAKYDYVADKKITVKVCDLRKQKGLFLYFPEDALEVIDEYKKLCTMVPNMQVVMLTDRNYQKLLNELKQHKLHNWIYYLDFFKTKNRYLSTSLAWHVCHEVWDLYMDHVKMNDNADILDKKAEKSFDAVEMKTYSRTGSVKADNINKYINIYVDNRWLDLSVFDEFAKEFSHVHRFDFLNIFNFYSNNRDLIKKFALTLYVKQKKDEKNGLRPYKVYNVHELIGKYLESIKPIELPVAQILPPEDDGEFSVIDEEFTSEDIEKQIALDSEDNLLEDTNLQEKIEEVSEIKSETEDEIFF